MNNLAEEFVFTTTPLLESNARRSLNGMQQVLKELQYLSRFLQEPIFLHSKLVLYKMTQLPDLQTLFAFFAQQEYVRKSHTIGVDQGNNI